MEREPHLFWSSSRGVLEVIDKVPLEKWKVAPDDYVPMGVDSEGYYFDCVLSNVGMAGANFGHSIEIVVKHRLGGSVSDVFITMPGEDEYKHRSPEITERVLKLVDELNKLGSTNANLASSRLPPMSAYE